MADERGTLSALVAPVVAGVGCDLEELTVTRMGRRRVVRVVVDGANGVALDTVAEVSKAISVALDSAEEAGKSIISGPYLLEVTSPGVDRPLTMPRHWQRNLGRRVRVAAGGTQWEGRIGTVTDLGVTLEVDNSDVPIELTFGELGPGRIQVEFRREEA